MNNKEDRILTVSMPLWFIIFMGICGIGVTIITVFYVVWVISNDKLDSHIFGCLFFISIVLAGLLFFSKIMFYSVTAVDKGLEANNIIGPRKFFHWNEIVEVRRPKFGIPNDASYVISNKRGKMMLLRGTKNYKNLIALIRLKAPNLKRCES